MGHRPIPTALAVFVLLQAKFARSSVLTARFLFRAWCKEKGLPLCMSRCGCHDEEAKNIGSIVELEVDDDQLNLPPPAMPAPASPAFRAPPAEVRGPTASELAGSATPTGCVTSL